MGAKTFPKTKTSSQAATGKSKVISTGKLGGAVKGGNTKMAGQQTVKAAKSR